MGACSCWAGEKKRGATTLYLTHLHTYCRFQLITRGQCFMPSTCPLADLLTSVPIQCHAVTLGSAPRIQLTHGAQPLYCKSDAALLTANHGSLTASATRSPSLRLSHFCAHTQP